MPEAYAGTKARVRGVSGEGSATRGTAGPDVAPGRRGASERTAAAGDRQGRRRSQGFKRERQATRVPPFGKRRNPMPHQVAEDGARALLVPEIAPPRGRAAFAPRRAAHKGLDRVPQRLAAPNGRQVAEDGARVPASRPRSAAAAADDCGQRDPSTPLAPRARFAQDDKRTSRRRWSEGARIPTQERRHRRGRLRPARSFDSARPAGSLRSGRQENAGSFDSARPAGSVRSG